MINNAVNNGSASSRNLRQVCTDPLLLQSGEIDIPDLIVTDQLPITQSLGPANGRLVTGEIGVLAIGTQSPGDVVLPSDCTQRELRLACRMLVEIVRLRRKLSEAQNSQRALHSMAFRDPLTGLANRRKWDQELAQRVPLMARKTGPAVLVIALLDIDFFKPINDRLGHVAGDLVLQRVAHGLTANVSDHHLVARVGGDEFGVVMDGLLAPDVASVIDSLRRAIQHQPDGSGQDEPVVTASAGVAIVPAGLHLAPIEAVTAADRALCDAKQQGRSRTVVVDLGNGSEQRRES